jgi:2-keto-3-deoxy-galactonokinase
MLQTTQTISPEFSFFAEECSLSTARIDLEKFFSNNDSFESNIMDLETKQQILKSSLFRIRQMSRLRRLSVTKLKR